MTENDAPEFCDALYSAMHQAGSTPKHLADELGVYRTTIQNWLQGIRIPSRDKAARIAIALNAPHLAPYGRDVGEFRKKRSKERSRIPPEELRKEFARALADWAEIRGLKTNAEIAEVCGAGVSTVQSWMAGDMLPSFAALYCIVRGLGIDLCDIMPDKEVYPPKENT